MSKKILLITKSFYPVNGPRSTRATELVKELARSGHSVTVLTPRNNKVHNSFETQYNVKILDLGRTFFTKPPEGAIPFWKKVILKISVESGLSDRYAFPDIFFMNITEKILQKHNDYDLIISIAKPHPIHWGVAKAIRNNPKLTKKWIADCGDPFMGNPFHKHAKFLEKFERLFCQYADFITIPIKDAIDSYYPEFRHKIKVIPQGFDFDKDTSDQLTYIKNEIPTFAYAGAFYKDKRDPRKLFEYLVNLDTPFKFVIYSSNFDLVNPFLKRAEGRFILKKYIPREDLLIELRKMDFLININNVSVVQSPSKLIDYYLTDRPVLSLSNNSVDEIALDEFFSGDYSKKYSFTNMEDYNIKNVVKNLLAL